EVGKGAEEDEHRRHEAVDQSAPPPSRNRANAAPNPKTEGDGDETEQYRPADRLANQLGNRRGELRERKPEIPPREVAQILQVLNRERLVGKSVGDAEAVQRAGIESGSVGRKDRLCRITRGQARQEEVHRDGDQRRQQVEPQSLDRIAHALSSAAPRYL